jgi:mono/diheme cytochrome c family protein
MSDRRRVLAALALAAATGCRQQMAEQPYYRPQDPSSFFADGRSSRPLERGVIHRAQHLESDPLATGLTREEWGRIYARKPVSAGQLPGRTPIEDREATEGVPRYDPRVAGNPKVFAETYPFPVTTDDLDRGQERYSIYCAVCHGPLGNGHGKIWERGYLQPTSFHTAPVAEPEARLRDFRDNEWYDEQPSKKTPVRLGYSRGYALWGISIPMREVPVGYVYEVIARGYGGMPNYSAQISPADRWRIVAYVRALQYSQHAPADANGAGGKK